MGRWVAVVLLWCGVSSKVHVVDSAFPRWKLPVGTSEVSSSGVQHIVMDPNGPPERTAVGLAEGSSRLPTGLPPEVPVFSPNAQVVAPGTPQRVEEPPPRPVAQPSLEAKDSSACPGEVERGAGELRRCNSDPMDVAVVLPNIANRTSLAAAQNRFHNEDSLQQDTVEFWFRVFTEHMVQTKKQWDQEHPDTEAETLVSSLPEACLQYPRFVVRLLLDGPCYSCLKDFATHFDTLDKLAAGLVPALAKALVSLLACSWVSFTWLIACCIIVAKLRLSSAVCSSFTGCP